MVTCFPEGAASLGSVLPQALVVPPAAACAAGVAVGGEAVLISTGRTVGAAVAAAADDGAAELDWVVAGAAPDELCAAADACDVAELVVVA